jgi:hypothetical protein
VLVVPFPYSGTSQVMVWQGDSNEPRTMIGGDFIAPDQSPHLSRAGRSALTNTTIYIDDLYAGIHVPKPSAAEVSADMATMKPQAVVAAVTPGSPVGQYMVQLFGPPTTDHGRVMGWRLTTAQAAALSRG